MLVSLFVGDSLGMPLSIIVYNYNNHLSENIKETKFTFIKIIQIVEVIKDKSSNFDHLLTLIGFISNLNLAIWGFRKSDCIHFLSHSFEWEARAVFCCLLQPQQQHLYY